MKSFRLRIAVVLLIGFMGTAASCSGSSSGSGTTSKTRSSGSDTGDLGGALDSLTGDCAKAGAAYFALSLSAAAAATGVSGADKTQIEDELTNLTDEIPDEIPNDFAVYAAALRQYVDAMTSAFVGDLMNSEAQGKAMDAAKEAAKLLETPKVIEAQANIEKYFETQCPSLSGDS
jgi:hypothetical protein